MKRKFILFFVASLMIHFTVNAQWTGSSTGSLSSGKPAGVKWDKTVHNFGTLEKGGSGKAIFKMTNTGGVPIIITSAEGTCGCTDITYPKQPILPGKTVNIIVNYEAEDKGAFNKSVRLSMNIEKKDPVLHIRGVVE